eukprot:GHVS01005992.1.p2 GENE.GHVS01005992.1~~GHVS01005992.1.p2  ORF type:complete len:119 (-),score=1.61 GHVS01005992.1:183-539(-)
MPDLGGPGKRSSGQEEGGADESTSAELNLGNLSRLKDLEGKTFGLFNWENRVDGGLCVMQAGVQKELFAVGSRTIINNPLTRLHTDKSGPTSARFCHPCCRRLFSRSSILTPSDGRAC